MRRACVRFAAAAEPSEDRLLSLACRYATRRAAADLAGTFDSESAEDKKIMDEMKASESSDFKWADKDKNGKMTYREHIMGTSYPPGHDAGPQDAHNPDTDNDKHVSLSEHLKSVTSELAEDLTEEEITEHKSADEELTVRDFRRPPVAHACGALQPPHSRCLNPRKLSRHNAIVIVLTVLSVLNKTKGLAVGVEHLSLSLHCRGRRRNASRRLTRTWTGNSPPRSTRRLSRRTWPAVCERDFKRGRGGRATRTNTTTVCRERRLC